MLASAFKEIQDELSENFKLSEIESIMQTAKIRAIISKHDSSVYNYMLADGSRINARAKNDKGNITIYPNHEMVKNCSFCPVDNSDLAEDTAAIEANLADAMARVASLNGLNINDVRNLFPAVLRMLKSNSIWAK